MSKENSTQGENNTQPNKRGFFANLFLVDDDAKNKVTTPKPENVQPQVVVPQPQQIITNAVGVVNQDIYKNLKEILTQRNLPGPDYLEVKTAADAMKSYIPDENQRFLVSYTSIKATSPKITKKIVTDSVDEYVKFIENERLIFQTESKEVFENEVTARQNRINSLNSDIENAKSEIQKLGEKIVTLTQEINTLNSEKLNKQNELEIKNKNFEVTIDTIVNELKSDKLKIETLINE